MVYIIIIDNDNDWEGEIMETKIKTLLHPVRIRILQSLLGGGEKTAQEISNVLSDVPIATLYRHLGTLEKERIIQISRENKVRGTVEKVYALSPTYQAETREEILNASREDHFNFFFTFMTHLLGDYDNYLRQDKIDLEKDGVSYRQLNLFLSDDELMEILLETRAIFSRHLDNRPTEKRRLRKISTIIIPEANQSNSKSGGSKR